MTINFDKVKKDDKSNIVTNFGDLCLGETFMIANAYRSDGLDWESNVLYLKTQGNTAIELNYCYAKKFFDSTLEVVAVDLEVNSVKLKGEK